MTTTDTTSGAAGPATPPIAHLADFPEGTMKMVKVDGHRVCLVHTSDGVHAIDHACPHEGYGLTQGDLQGDLVTCEWHNWKFRVTDGACVLGEEDVRVHECEIGEDGAIRVRLHEPSPNELRPQLLASLRRGIAKDYMGQVSRDVVRLLQADANPGELIWEAVAHGAPRAEFGWGHSIASATDCLAMIDLFAGDQRALPIVQGISGVAEVERDRPVNPLPDPAPAGESTAAAFRAAVEAEELERAQSLILGAIERGDPPAALRPWFTAVVSDHHLSYGHGAIYAQKAFELLDMIGHDRAATVLPYLVPSNVYGTREDKLPYMRPFMKSLAEFDLAALARIDSDPSWRDDGTMLDAVLGHDKRAPVTATVEALRGGAGVDGVLDVVVHAVSERMLRYDTDTESDLLDDFGWLDITHGLTYAHAARWHHRQAMESESGPTPDLIRLALFTVFLAHWTGRHEWHTTVGPSADVERPTGIGSGDLTGADLIAYAEALQQASLADGATAFIVLAHDVKMSRAAALEAPRVGSPLSLDATARYMTAPRQERRVRATVARSIDFVNGKVRRD
jgi:nitrite reductase/ring-hydroxylating ferredoxin subunit